MMWMRVPLALILAIVIASSVLLTGKTDSSTDASWSRITAMPTARSELAVAELDGRIYAAGGIGQWGTSDAFEAYDIASARWTRLAPLPAATHHPAMAAVDGRVYLSGGYGDIFFNKTHKGLWAYDPASDEWRRATTMPGPRAAHKLIALGGKLYVIGGRGPKSTALWVYDPANYTWDKSRAPLPTAREHLAATVVDDILYVIGGRRRDHVNLAVVEAYDPKTNKWVRKADLPKPQGGLTAAALAGHIHVTGGEDINAGKVSAAHWVYDPGKDRWRQETKMPTARHGVDSATSAGKWYVIGGGTAAGYRTIFALTNRVEVFSAP